jgi:hypothetical protein
VAAPADSGYRNVTGVAVPVAVAVPVVAVTTRRTAPPTPAAVPVEEA